MTSDKADEMPKGQPQYGYVLTPQREKVLRILAAAGGSLDDESGLVVSKLREQTGHETTQSLSMVIKQLEESGLIKRDVTGRRTYHLEIVPDALAPEHRTRLGIADRTEIGAVEPEPSEELKDDAPAEATDYRRLADELLKAATAALASKAGDPRLKIRVAELEEQLREERSRSDDLTTQLIERGEELLQLKEQLRIAEHNLEAVRKQQAKQKAERGSDKIVEKLTPREVRELEALKRLMQERPGT